MLPSDSAAEEDHRPGSANSDSHSERPTSGVSSRSGAIISNAKSSLREVAEEDQDDNNSPSNENDNNENSQPTMEIKPSDNDEEDKTMNDTPRTDNANRQMYELEDNGPLNETKLQDIVDEVPENVISRPNTPGNWAFDEKEPSLHTKPPRPKSATMCSPPIPRKTPVSVDHHLRK